MTPEQLQQATGCRIISAAKYSQALTDAMAKYGIKSRFAQAAFIANCAHESGLFTAVTENLFYTSADRLAALYKRAFKSAAEAQPYAKNPAALAKKLYDGYQGRGLIQLTWKANYEAYQAASGVPVVSNPDLLLEAKHAADSAAWFFAKHGLIAAADRQDWDAVTRGINGPAMLGNADRKALIARCLKVL